MSSKPEELVIDVLYYVIWIGLILCIGSCTANQVIDTVYKYNQMTCEGDK